MKRAVFIALVLSAWAVGISALAVIGFAIWVLVTGKGYLFLFFLPNQHWAPVTKFLIVVLVAAAVALSSFWTVRVILRRLAT